MNYFLSMKKNLVLTICITLCIQVSAQLANTLPKNEYGLQVIDNQLFYKQSIKENANKQMVLVKQYLKQFKITFYYATAHNFTKQPLYYKPILMVRKAAVLALQGVEKDLATQNMGLIFYDAYRPYSVTKTMWKIVPDDRYAANPANGSGHNRGAAVDVGLYNLATGKIVDMPTAFDDFTEKAHHNYMQLDSAVISHRNILKQAMEKNGFVALATEWWHYSLPNAAKLFELLDIDFRNLKKWSK
jgi:zinc D-Ala-D-Ala dipeptidase